MNPCFETATSLARAIRNGKLTSREATEAHLERIDAAERADQCPGRGRSRGRLEGRARRRPGAAKKGAKLGPLHGVPITIKEAFDVAGLRTTSSHPPLKDNVAKADASLVARLRAAGAVILGKTNVPELCADFQTDSPLFGTTRNPWDPARGAGGSTGGGAAAVAARLSPLELGSDIGGSVRNPAHYNGIFSLKPTEWRVPSRGHVPDLPGITRAVRYMGVFGPLARSVDDLETGAAHHRRARRLRGRGAAGADRADAQAQGRRTSGSPCSSPTRWWKCRTTRRRSCRRPRSCCPRPAPR